MQLTLTFPTRVGTFTERVCTVWENLPPSKIPLLERCPVGYPVNAHFPNMTCHSTQTSTKESNLLMQIMQEGGREAKIAKEFSFRFLTGANTASLTLHVLFHVLDLCQWKYSRLTIIICVIIWTNRQHKNTHSLSTPRYTQTNMSPHKFDHFCIHYQASYVPQRLKFTNELVHFWSGENTPSLRETPTFKHVHPSAMLQLH